MEQEKRKKLILIGTLAMAIIFITSLTSLSNNGSANSTTTTIKPENTTLAIGYANAIVSSYGSRLTISFSNTSGNLSSKVSSELAILSKNGSVNDFIPSGNSFIIYPGNMSAYGIVSAINGTAMGKGGFYVNATTNLKLPSVLSLYSNGQLLPTRVPANQTYGLQSNSLESIGSTITVKVQALVYANATGSGAYSIYNNNVLIYPNG
jgi:hypothetical protein